MWHWLFIAPWLIFAAWWLVRMRDTARTETRESHVSRLTHVVFLGGGGILMVVAIAPLQTVGFGWQFQKLHTRRPDLVLERATGQETHPPAAGEQSGRHGEHRTDMPLGRHAAQNR